MFRLEAEIQRRERIQEEAEQVSRETSVASCLDQRCQESVLFRETIASLDKQLNEKLLENKELMQKNKDLEEKLARLPSSPPLASPCQDPGPTTASPPNSPQQYYMLHLLLLILIHVAFLDKKGPLVWNASQVKATNFKRRPPQRFRRKKSMTARTRRTMTQKMDSINQVVILEGAVHE